MDSPCCRNESNLGMTLLSLDITWGIVLWRKRSASESTLNEVLYAPTQRYHTPHTTSRKPQKRKIPRRFPVFDKYSPIGCKRMRKDFCHLLWPPPFFFFSYPPSTPPSTVPMDSADSNRLESLLFPTRTWAFPWTWWYALCHDSKQRRNSIKGHWVNLRLVPLSHGTDTISRVPVELMRKMRCGDRVVGGWYRWGMSYPRMVTAHISGKDTNSTEVEIRISNSRMIKRDLRSIRRKDWRMGSAFHVCCKRI